MFKRIWNNYVHIIILQLFFTCSREIMNHLKLYWTLVNTWTCPHWALRKEKPRNGCQRVSYSEKTHVGFKHVSTCTEYPNKVCCFETQGTSRILKVPFSLDQSWPKKNLHNRAWLYAPGCAGPQRLPTLYVPFMQLSSCNQTTLCVLKQSMYTSIAWDVYRHNQH